MILDRVPSSIWSVKVRGQSGTQRVFTTRDEARAYRKTLRSQGTSGDRIVMRSHPVETPVTYTK